MDIQGASGTLNFTDLMVANMITVQDSPVLEVLSFPQLPVLQSLEIVDATALTTVSLPKLTTGIDTAQVTLSLNITSAPNLATFLVENSTIFGHLALLDTPPGFSSTRNITDSIKIANSIQTDSLTSFLSLQDVGELKISARPGFNYGFFSLKSVNNMTLLNANNFFHLNLRPGFGPSIQVEDTLLIESSVLPDRTFLSDALDFSRISSVGKNMKISSMSDVGMIFDGLVDVGASLEISGNTNCSFSFNNISSLTTLTALDNTNTTLPLFLQLKTAENIHLRGIIDT
jgi:hypothetical protein